MIVMFHFSEGHHYSGWRPLDLLACRGYLWVEFFFVLSGFILTYSYRARAAELVRASGYLAFLRARLIRLYPLHLFMLLWILGMVIVFRALSAWGGYLSIFDAPYHQDVSLKGFFLSLILVHAWNTLNTLTWNGVSWFVSVEFALCLMFPALLRLIGNDAVRGLVFIGAGLGGLIALLITSRHGLDITYHNGVLRGLCDFAIGMGLAVLFGHRRGDTLPEWGHTLIQSVLLLLLGYAVLETGWSHTTHDIWTVLPLMALVPALSFDRGIVARLLALRLPQMLGAWSYGIYLGQTACLLGIRVLEQRLYPPAHALVWGAHFSSLIWWLEPLGLVAACVIWGALLARFVEQPSADWLRARLGRRLDPRSVPTPT